jgi:hypothetical protein
VKSHLFTIALLVAAAIYYTAHVATGALALLILAGIVELAFWVRYLDVRRQ